MSGATDSDGFGRCKWCGNLTDSAGCLNLTCAARTAATYTPPDAEAVAREGVWGALEDWQNTTRTTAQVHRDVDAALDAYRAAVAEAVERRVRAECAAKVDAQADALDADIGNESAVRILRKLARTLEAHP